MQIRPNQQKRPLEAQQLPLLVDACKRNQPISITIPKRFQQTKISEQHEAFPDQVLVDSPCEYREESVEV
jgi:hypothetical protein